VIEHHLQLSPVTAGYCSLILGLAWMVGGFISKATINRPFFRKLAVNAGLQLLFALTMLACIRVADHLYPMVFFAFIIHVCAGYTFNNYMTFCMTRFPKNAGIASGLTGGLTFVIVSLSSYGIVTILPARDAHNLAYSYLVLIFVSALLLFITARREMATGSKTAFT
jgi:hypothetical protein